MTIAGERAPVTATPAEGPDESVIFQRFVQVASTYAAYRDRTTRDLCIFALTRT